MSTFHKVENIKIDQDYLSLVIDGQAHTYELRSISRLLSAATEEERNTFSISPSGYGINWPLIDEDISIDGLLGVVHNPNQARA